MFKGKKCYRQNSQGQALEHHESMVRDLVLLECKISFFVYCIICDITLNKYLKYVPKKSKL